MAGLEQTLIITQGALIVIAFGFKDLYKKTGLTEQDYKVLLDNPSKIYKGYKLFTSM